MMEKRQQLMICSDPSICLSALSTLQLSLRLTLSSRMSQRECQRRFKTTPLDCNGILKQDLATTKKSFWERSFQVHL